MPDQLTITAYSTALYATWIFIEEPRLLLDAGDGVSAGLLGKARKIEAVAVTHPDRDHLTGLPQLLQLNARDGKPQVLYPRDSGSFPALARFCKEFDPHSGEATWTGVAPGQEVSLLGDFRLRVRENLHIDKPDQVKSVGYQLVKVSQRLNAEYLGKSATEMAAMTKALGRPALTEPFETPVLGYSGDTRVDAAHPWRSCGILIHESTFLRGEDAGARRPPHQHSVLGDVLRMAMDVCPQSLVLCHFSSRYRAEEVLEAVRAEAAALAPPFPIYVIPPGIIVRDVLAQEPVWTP